MWSIMDISTIHERVVLELFKGHTQVKKLRTNSSCNFGGKRKYPIICHPQSKDTVKMVLYYKFMPKNLRTREANDVNP